MIETKHGFIDLDEASRITDIEDPFAPNFDLTLAQICAYGVDHGFTHLWVMPGVVNPDIDYFRAAKEEWDLLPTWELKAAPAGVPNRLRSVTGFRQKHLNARGNARNSINVIFCGQLAAWEWARNGLLTAKQAANIITSMEKLLGAPVSGSPGNTGWVYLQQVNRNRVNYFERPAPDDDYIQFGDIPWSSAVQNILWTRVPTEEELARKYLVRIDKNAAFPRAAYDCKFGVNAVKHYLGDRVEELWLDGDGSRMPGIWKIELQPKHTDHPLLPPAFSDTIVQWVTTPALRYAMSHYEIARVAMQEAWLFPQSHYVLRETMDKLWDFRQKFPAGDLLNGAFKQIMVDLPGLFRMPELKHTPKYRPDWYAQITGGNFAIMQQNIRKFAELFGLHPILVHVDCIMYCSDKPLADLMPDNRTDMGHFKHELETPMDDRIRGILSNPDLNSATKLAALAKYLEEPAYDNYDFLDYGQDGDEDEDEDEDEVFWEEMTSE